MSESANTMTTTTSTSTSPSSTSSTPPSSSLSSPPPPALRLPSPFPYADAPDIIRAHQKDAYFEGTLANDLAELVRRFGGGRTAHAWAAETRTGAALAYWGLTSWLGHRTLGEEYCDLVMVRGAGAGGEDSDDNAAATTVRLPAAPVRAAYVLSSVLGPYLAGRLLPRVRQALRRRLEGWEAAATGGATTEKSRRSSTLGALRARLAVRLRPLTRYLLRNLDGLTSGTHVRAVTLALFYFYGAYYTLTTRLLGLRYVLTRRRPAAAAAAAEGGGDPASGTSSASSSSSSTDDVVGYEVLGALLVLQLAVQGYRHVRETWQGADKENDNDDDAVANGSRSTTAAAALPVDVSLSHDSYTANNELLLGGPEDATSSSSPAAALARLTRTPAPPPRAGGVRFDLQARDTMKWLGAPAQRQCTLCLEVLADPAATPCGHVFCWRCIQDWVREKPECPLCRRAAQAQHLLPLRAL